MIKRRFFNVKCFCVLRTVAGEINYISSTGSLRLISDCITKIVLMEGELQTPQILQKNPLLDLNRSQLLFIS